MAADADVRELEAELQRRSAIIEAVRLAAEHLLVPDVSWEQRLREVLAGLARATGTSRVYLFENTRFDDDGEVWCTQRVEWSAPDVRSVADDPWLANLPMRAAGLGRWLDVLLRGETVAGLRDEMLPVEQEQLARDGTLSIALVPIIVDGGYWGMLGFDECAYERVWSAGELDALRTAAGTIAAAIHADRAATQLRARETEYRAVFEATSDGLAICDRDGRLVAANPAFCEMHGQPLAALEGRSAGAWLHGEQRLLQGGYFELAAEGAVLSTDALNVRGDGSTFPVEIRSSRLLFRGEPHVLLAVRDVTERARMRGLLEQRVGALSMVAESLTVDQPLDQMLSGVCRIVVEATDALAATVQLVDEESGAVQVLAQHGQPEGYAEGLEAISRSGLDSSVTLAVRDQDLKLVHGTRETTLGDVQWAPLHRHLEQVTWSDVLVVPLDALGRNVGALNLYLPQGADPDDAARSFFRAIADQAAAAVENARLFHAAQGAAVLEERQRIARELHDSVSQALYGIALGARTARSVVEQDPPRAVEPLEYVLNLAEAGLAEMRALIFELRPDALAVEGLVTALDRQLKALRVRHDLEVVGDLGDEPELPLPVKEVLYRVAQEALNNTVKHASAARVVVSLTLSGQQVRIQVSDDGVGFDPGGSFPGHLGLRSMQERADGVGGTLEVTSAPGQGTDVTLTVPAADV